ncbi:MAG: AAA family ATPase [Solirubrobacteraceae bacterium]
MRLTSIELSGFRAFSRPEHFDLDADAVLVLGANGQGKTSLFDGVLWALTGSIPRFSSPESVLSMWSDSGQAYVELGLAGDSGAFTLGRTFDGRATSLALTRADGQTLRGPEAETETLRLLWSDALSAVEPQKALCSALERGAYLQQDLVTQFIGADTPQERFAAISELIGSGRIRELQEALEQARRAWSRATTTKSHERDEVAARVASLSRRLDQLAQSQGEVGPSEEAWNSWWSLYGSLVGAVAKPVLGGADAVPILDASIRELQAIQPGSERRREAAARAVQEHTNLPARPDENLEALLANVAAAEAEVQAAQQALRKAQEQASALRRQQVELEEQRASLAALAGLAIQHLGDRCPVCGQDYDRAHTEHRLEALRQSESHTPPREQIDISAFAARVELAEKALNNALTAHADAQRRIATWEEHLAHSQSLLAELELSPAMPDEQLPVLMELLEDLDKRMDMLAQLRSDGETLLLSAARAGEAARGTEIRLELEGQRTVLKQMDAELAARKATGDTATDIIEGLREASADVVAAQLERLAPLVRRFFATADPHPAFRDARLLSTFTGGRGRVVPSVSDPVTDKESETPHEVLSSSQLNVLAVAVFLAMNLGMPALPVRAAILDDPLQSLDDLNLLGLVDLFRRLRARRQLLVSTHDERFGQLLRRKLRPVSDEQRTVVIEFEGWTRTGPQVRQTEVERDKCPLRIAA